MKLLSLVVIGCLPITIGLSQSALSTEADFCTPVSTDISCKARCLSNIGELCLIKRFRFSGTIDDEAKPFLKAGFQTCVGARVDLSVKDIFIELQTKQTEDAEFDLAMIANSEAGQVEINHSGVLLQSEKHTAFVGRVSANKMLPSGDGLMEVKVSAPSCGGENSDQLCKISGTIEAVTDPNIRCELRDKSKPGAYLEHQIQMNRERPVLLSPYTFN